MDISQIFEWSVVSAGILANLAAIMSFVESKLKKTESPPKLALAPFTKGVQIKHPWIALGAIVALLPGLSASIMVTSVPQDVTRYPVANQFAYIGLILSLAPWVGALISTGRLHSWGWFNAILFIGGALYALPITFVGGGILFFLLPPLVPLVFSFFA